MTDETRESIGTIWHTTEKGKDIVSMHDYQYRALLAAVAERDEAIRVARTMLDEVNTAHARLSTKLAAAEKVVGKAENIRKEWTAKHVVNTPLDLAVVELICQLTTYQAVEAAKGGTKC